MAPMNALALAACLLCVATGLAMTFLVLRESPRSRDSQLMAAYFLAAATGAGAVFLARVSALIGADASPYFYASYDAMALAFCALLALATHYAGLWRRRWIPSRACWRSSSK